MAKTYEAPVLVELGHANTLIMGGGDEPFETELPQVIPVGITSEDE